MITDYFDTESTGDIEYDKTEVKMTTETNFITNDYFQTEAGQAFLGECKDIITEGIHNWHWDLITMYHELGKTIVQDEGFQKYAKGNARSLQYLATSIGIPLRNVYNAIECYQKFPDKSFPEGKAISWTKLVTKYLPSGEKKQHTCEHKPVITCKICKKDLSEEYAPPQSL